MTELNRVGSKELLVWRMFMAILSSIVVQFFFMSCVILITNLSIVHPLSWIQDTWKVVTCLRTWSYFLVLATVIFLQGIICSRNYLSPPLYLKTRFEILCNMFIPHNILVGGLHMMVGAVLVWLHLSLEGGPFSALTTECKTMHGSCLVEEHIFLLLGGLWTGFYFFSRANFFSLQHLQFPIIPQSKFAQIKRGIGSMLPSTLLSAVWPTLYFMIFYYILGGYCRKIALSAFFIQNEDNAPLDRLSGLLNVSLVFHSWLFAVLFELTMNTMHLLFQAHLTEWVAFDIGQTGVFKNESSGVTLAEALAMEAMPIMQHLGYLDLVILAQKDKRRRSALFTLSQPGGHPYNWNCVIEKCLSLISKFTSELTTACSTTQANRPASGITMATPSTQLSEKTYQYNMRNLTAAGISSHSSMDSTSSRQLQPPGEQFLLKFIQKKRDSFAAYLLSKPLIYYMFGESTESKIRHILISGQPVVWAADAVSSLSEASLIEDPYGIVQKDLAVIIEALLVLKQGLDKLQKANVFMKRQQSEEKETRQMAACLRSAVKRSIYRITSTFRDYIKDLVLEPATIEQLQCFLSYRD